MAWQNPSDPLCTNITAIWGLLHRRRVMGPSLGASAAWAVTFVPEWNFDSLLFCVGFFFFFFFPRSVCPLSLSIWMPLLTFTPPLSSQVRLSSPITTVKVTFGTICYDGQSDVDARGSALNETREMNAPLGHLSWIHRLPGCTTKNEKKKNNNKKRQQLYFSLFWAPAGLISVPQMNMSVC